MKTKSTLVRSLIAVLVLLFASSAAYSQLDYSTCTQCVSNDVKITSVFAGDASGNPLPSCTTGEVKEAHLVISLTSNTPRQGLFFRAKVVTTSSGTTNFANCFNVNLSTQSQVISAGTFTYTCGDMITLQSVFIAWDANSDICAGVYTSTGGVKSTCADYAPKCWNQPTGQSIIVEVCAPPSGNTTICVGGTSQLAGTGTITAWTTSNSSVATVSNTGLVTGVSAGTAVIGFTTSRGCTATTTVTVSPPPTITIGGMTASNTSICANGSVNVSASANNASIINWSVTGGAGLSTTTGSSVTFTPPTSGTYTITATATGTGGCSTATASATYLVNVTAAPTATFTGGGNMSSTSTCSNAPVTVSGFTSSGGSVLWTIQSGSGSITAGANTDAPTFTPANGQSTPTTLLATVTGSGACSSATATATYTINVTAAPAITISGGQASSTSICSNAPVTVTGVNAVNGSIAWTIQSGTGSVTSGANTTSPVFTPNGAGTTVLLATVTGTNACSSATATATYTIDVTAAPTAVTASGASSTICSNGTATVSGVTLTGGMIVWTENGAGSITAGQGTATPTYTAAAGDGGNTVTLVATVTGSGACSAATASTTYTINVTAVPSAPTITASGSTNLCGDEASVTLTSSAASNVWYLNGVAVNGGVAFSGSFIVNTAGIYQAFAENNGCVSVAGSNTITVTVNPVPPAPTSTANQFFCTNQNATVASLSAIGSNIQWYANASGGTALLSGTALSNGSTYWATQTVNGCESGTRTSTTVTISACTATFIIDRIDPSCAGQANGSIHIQLTGGGTPTFTISFDEGKTYEPVNNTTLRVDKYNLPAGIYNIFLKHGDGLVQPLSTTTLIDPAPITATLSTTGSITCTNSAVTLNVSNIQNGAGAPYQISVDGGAFTTTTSFSVGSGVHTVTVRDRNGCARVVGTVNVAGVAPLTVSGPNVTNASAFGSSNGAINLTATGGSGAYTITLDRPNGSSTSVSAGSSSVSFTGLPAGTYTITITDKSGCGSLVRSVTVAQPQQAPLPADLVLGSESSTNTFPAPGSNLTIVYHVANVSQTGTAFTVKLRVTKPNREYDITLPNAVTYTTAAGTVYTLDNARWTKTADNDTYIELSLDSDPGGQNFIPAATFIPKHITVVVTRKATATGKGEFPITGMVYASLPDANDLDNTTIHRYNAQ